VVAVLSRTGGGVTLLADAVFAGVCHYGRYLHLAATFSVTIFQPLCFQQEEVVLGGSGSLKTIDTLLAHIDKITHDAKSGHSQDKSVNQKLTHEDDKEVCWGWHTVLLLIVLLMVLLGCLVFKVLVLLVLQRRSRHPAGISCETLRDRYHRAGWLASVYYLPGSRGVPDGVIVPLRAPVLPLVGLPSHDSPLLPFHQQNSVAPKAVRKDLGHMNKALEAAQAADKALKNNNGAQNSAAEEKKKKAIARKMRALTAQIQSDFEKVTGFGNKAGYVPPVKMPHM